MPSYTTIETLIGNTPLVKLQHLNQTSNTILLKLEGQNPAGSVKDRAALNMILQAEKRGEIKPGDTLIEPTSGNTGIALAMVASIKNYQMILVMPDNMSLERRGSMSAYGAELILTPKKNGMEGAIDTAKKLAAKGAGKIINQFDNPDNSDAHIRSTGPEIWRDTKGKISHFVSAMGTTGTIMGVSHYLKQQNPNIKIIGVQPDDKSSIPGIRKWPDEYLPKIFDKNAVDEIMEMSQQEAEATTLKLATEEGIFCGVSSGGAVAAALRLAQKITNSTIVTIICDRGDRYLSTGLFNK